MKLKIVVLVKQVPDTKNISGEAMKEDGTVNRIALPAIFNPEDLNALEMGLQLREQYGGAVTVLTMGPPKAAQVLRESLYRGADRVVLITDRQFAGADTLATSYTLTCAIKKIEPDFDLVLCGRQAIDGDTAQVGPQTAEKLGVPQVTYAAQIESIADGKMVVRREFDSGYELVLTTLPALLTVLETANEPRPPKAKKMMIYKNAACELELSDLWPKFQKFSDIEEFRDYLKQKSLYIPVITTDDLDIKLNRIGLNGSPTKVKKINSVVLTGGELKLFETTNEAVRNLINELVEDYILG